MRNDNDLVWVGRAANYAAKLCAIREYDTTFITEEVFNVLLDADGRIYREPLIETVPLYESSQQTFATIVQNFLGSTMANEASCRHCGVHHTGFIPQDAPTLRPSALGFPRVRREPERCRITAEHEH